MNIERTIPAILLFAAATSVLAPPATHAQRYELVWEDNFDGTSVDWTTWSPWIGTAYNGEAQYYRKENASVSDGVLYLTAKRQDFAGRKYTSARLESWPYHGARGAGKAWKYGRFEVRAKMPPAGDGFWPALWLMPALNPYGPWPYSGEIDMMEWRSHDPGQVHGTIHYSCCEYPGSGNALSDRRSIGGAFVLPEGTFSDDYHTFGVEWDETGVRWFADSTFFHSITPQRLGAELYPFNKPFYIILNLAVGGQYIDYKLPPAGFTEASLLVDYVRVYQDLNQAPSASLQALPDSLPALTPIVLAADVSDEDGGVVRVHFFSGDTLIATDDDEPFSIAWTTPTDGCHSVRVQAEDNDGGISALSDSTWLVVGSGCSHRPFHDVAIPLPGTLNFADYDWGGQNVAYYDSSPIVNMGNAEGNTYRKTEGVDLLPALDEGAMPDVAFVEEGEWLKYTVDVAKTGLYDLELTAAPVVFNDRVTLEIDGEPLARFYRLNPPSGERPYTTSTAANIGLSAGQHVLRVVPERPGARLRSLAVALKQETASEQPAPWDTLVLEPNFPNPFRGATTVVFGLPAAGYARLDVYDLLGRHIQTAADGTFASGEHTVRIDASGLAAGVYLYVLTSDEGRRSAPMHVLP